MTKLLLILFIGLVCETTGVVLLKKGMTRVGNVEVSGLAQIVKVVKAGVTEPQILLGVFFEALFFICLLILMAKSEISFLWPLTALSFVFATFGAMWFLNEKVSPVRWAGVVLIMMGAALISYSEHIKEKGATTVSASTPLPR
ncbi:MAG TPA: EamA family transporter [Verrucomicrobiae bacterium]|nr:EamA family transporter [Verrucomicrobiae bacterium]